MALCSLSARGPQLTIEMLQQEALQGLGSARQALILVCLHLQAWHLTSVVGAATRQKACNRTQRGTGRDMPGRSLAACMPLALAGCQRPNRLWVVKIKILGWQAALG